MRWAWCLFSLWAVFIFSRGGTAFPVMARDPALETLAWLFPLRHYFVIYQTSIFSGYSLTYCWVNIACLIAFALLPLPLMGRLKKVMMTFKYMD